MKNTIVKGVVCMVLLGTSFGGVLDIVTGDQDGEYTYTVSNGQATITDYSCAGTVITIPSTLGGYPTVAIGDNAFYACSFMTSVTIPASVTTIGPKAFKSCTSLASITIPDSVTTIGDYAFYYCSSLTTVTIGDGVTTIGAHAFSYCPLTSVSFGDGVTTIGDNAFSYCPSLTSITITDNIRTIGTNAFSYCSSLNAVTIGNNVTTVGYNAFSYCPLVSVTIPDSVTTIDGYAFYSCSSLTSVTIGTGVKTIGSYAFASCVSLTSITFLGLVQPKTVGNNWIKDTPADILGHAYAASDFPAPGEMVNFHGLKMGTVVPVINKQPRASFIWSPANLTVNQSISFDASASSDEDGSIVLYEWDWNNDGVYEESSSAPTATHSWTVAGDHPVTLRVMDSGNATATKTLSLSLSSGDEDGTGDTNGTPGFELIVLLCAIAVLVGLLRKKRIV